MPVNLKTTKPKPVVLIVLDGWGLGEKSRSNPLENAHLPTFEKLNQYYPHLAIQASGISVGLPWGEPGNSEVGHMTLGAGNVIYQNMPRITMAIQDGEFYKNPVLVNAAQRARKTESAIHLMGLVSKGSVHSNMDHLYALLEMMAYQKVKNVYLHVFTDGRDSPPTSGLELIKELQVKLDKLSVGKIATIGGRYFAMDRNNNWDRIEKSYKTMVEGTGQRTPDPVAYLRSSYKKEIYDEYIEPACIFEGERPVATINDGDAVIFFNYREDRARQMTKAFSVPSFSNFKAAKFKDLEFVTLTQYEDNLPVEVAFPPVKIKGCLGKVLSENGCYQLRIAETEKFAHVTYFFNGGKETAFPGEDRIIVPSKDTDSFAKIPEMSAFEITEKVLENIAADKYDFILMNFANADIVGHTGDLKAAIKALETIDNCLEKIIKAVVMKDGCVLITADHGNVEEMVNLHTGERDTEHSSNPVPLWYITAHNHKNSSDMAPFEVSGLLSDIAPTILEVLKVPKPEEMTGESLISLLK